MNETLAPDDVLVAAVRDADHAAWDRFVLNTPGGTFCHLAGWRRVIGDVMGQDPCYLAAWNSDGAIRGVLPLVRLRSVLFGTRYVSMPYLNDGGPLGDREAVVALRSRAVELADGSNLELRVRRVDGAAAGESRKVTVLLELGADPESLWGNLPSKVRSQIRRPQKAGMTVRFGVEELSSFYDVWSRNMRDLGTPVLPRRLFDAIAAEFPEYFLVGTVYRGDEAVAAGAGFAFRGEFEMTWASALREHSREAPNMLLYWEFMVKALERGAGTFNFGRCTPGEGTHRFKLQWGGESVPLGWITSGAREAGSPGRLAQLASSAWERLPLAVANRIGPPVARQLPWW